MGFEHLGNRCYGWCPEDPQGPEHLALSKVLLEGMGREAGEWWLKEIERLALRRDVLEVGGLGRLVQEICKHDCPELAELLYPRFPELFWRPQKGFSALNLCAAYGSAGTLWTLLELGADPNGLDCPGELCSFIDNRKGRGFRTIHFLATPLDYALQEGWGECALLLELYGGLPSKELLGGSEEEGWPRFFPTPDLGINAVLDDQWYALQEWYDLERWRALMEWYAKLGAA